MVEHLYQALLGYLGQGFGNGPAQQLPARKYLLVGGVGELVAMPGTTPNTYEYRSFGKQSAVGSALVFGSLIGVVGPKTRAACGPPWSSGCARLFQVLAAY
ncbi:hypothetical protein GKZ68_18475 [Hymenobacter sp. BRD128]|uniref:hypothetical protein n=1 Tax=Hymenobacter sp. BRD128 TaxID=2675878 RepID=UPI0015676A1C|nr:hypothetical protein [Hymenobacter sp. BRD128]QKG58441.1 hypothetical protein GKZ68_18475 [Hymenobacter sp. BRD128]